MYKQRLKHSDITEKIIGCAMKVHSHFGMGFQEAIYQRCMQIEFDKLKLTYQYEAEIPILYDNIEVGTRRIDFLVENVILVELKAVKELDDSHFNQILNYLTIFKLEVGLLLNFGEKSLKFKRIIHTINKDH